MFVQVLIHGVDECGGNGFIKSVHARDSWLCSILLLLKINVVLTAESQFGSCSWLINSPWEASAIGLCKV